MILLMDGGLNLNDPLVIKETELAIALNADFRKKGIVRSRDGRVSVYTSQGTNLIHSSANHLYSVGSDVFKDGTALSATITSPTSIGLAKLSNVSNEVCLLSAQNNYKIDGSDVLLWGIAAPTVAPTDVALAGGSMAVGTYYYKYTYARYIGSALVHESNPSPVSGGVALSGGNLQVTFTATAPGDAQVTHINVYRTLVGGAAASNDFFFDQSIALSTVTATSSQTDTQLGALVETDNDPPPASTFNAIAGPGAYGVIFVAFGNTVYFSKARRPESFPPDYYFEVGVPSQLILGLIDWGGLIFILTTNEIYFIQGTDADSFYPVKTQATRGLVSRYAVRATPAGIVYLSYDGLYLFNGHSEVKITGEKVDSLFRGETVNTVAPINRDALTACWLEYWNGKLLLGFPTATNTIPDKVLVLDTEEQKASIYDYGVLLRSVFADKDNNRLLAGDSNGTVWQLETGESDAGSSFTFKVRSRELSGLAHVTPSYMRHDITNGSEETIYTRLLSKGTTVHSATITDSEDHKRRVINMEHFDSMQVEIESLTAGRIEIGAIELL